ncbi:MAG: hypothetical protein ACLR6J_18035 [Parabacteroides merdae]
MEKVYGSFDDPNCTSKTSFRPGDRIRFEATAEDGQCQAGCEVEIPFPIEETIRVRYAPYAIEGWFQHDGLYAIQNNDT